MARGVPRSPFDSCSLFITRREEAIEKALQVRLAQIAEERARKRAEARKARDKLAAEVLVLARQVFAMLDVDDGGTLSRDEIVRGVEEDEEVVKFLINCGNEYLAALLKPKKLEKALIEIDTDGSGEVDLEEWEAAVLAGLEKRLQAMAEDRERRERAAAAADGQFTAEFLKLAEEIFDMIDEDKSDTLTHDELTNAVKHNRKVQDFLKGCGNKNLQYLLVPSRLQNALKVMDTNDDGEIDRSEWQAAIEAALKAKLAARQAERDARAEAARKELEEFTAEFLNAARKAFKLMDKDKSGTLVKQEVVDAVQNDKEVVTFLQTCGERNLQFLLQPKRIDKAMKELDTSKDGEIDEDEWEVAIQRGLKKRVEQLQEARARREQAAAAEDAAFSEAFLNMARQIFDMMDVDSSGSLDRGEIMKAVKSNKEVIAFLVNCGNKYLQDLLVPARLEATLDELDADLDGEISAPEWERAIAEALKEKLRQRALDREERARAWRKEMEAFTAEFMAAAQKVFEMIDKDGSGSLAIDEITRAVKEEQEVIDFLENCGEPNLQFLLRPKRLKKALEALDTDKSGEVDEEEWDEAIHRGLAARLEQLREERERRERAARAEDEAFSAAFLNAAREVFMLMDKDDSGSLSHQEILGAVKTNAEVKKFLNDCGDRNLQYLLMPSKLEASLKAIDSDGSGEIELPEWEAAIETALKAKLAQRAADRERRAKEAAAEIAAFTAEFLNAARKVFEMIDKDDSGALAKAEIVEAVKSDEEVKDFLQNCGEENLQFLLKPKRLDHALQQLDTDNSGEVDVEECAARRPTCHAIDVHWLICAQGRRRSTAASRSASSSSPTSASGASAPPPPPTRSSARAF